MGLIIICLTFLRLYFLARRDEHVSYFRCRDGSGVVDVVGLKALQNLVLDPLPLRVLVHDLEERSKVNTALWNSIQRSENLGGAV